MTASRRTGVAARRRAHVPYAAAALAMIISAAGCTVSGDDPEASPATSSPSASGPGQTPTLPPGEGLDPYYAQELVWNPCGSEGFECSTLLVPLDYDDPSGRSIEVVLSRLPATGDRIGSLVLNPGGPGGSGVQYIQQSDVVTEQVRERYDLVGFDPRGVGSSTPVDCLDDAELDAFLALDASPDDDAEAAALDDAAAAFAAGCEERSGDLLPHVGTVDVARDLDVLRAVLGDDQLHYLGFSYGTLIGALYAEQFPDNVGRMVLDGVVDPTQTAEESALGQARGFDQALRAFLEDCQLYLTECPLIGEIDDGVAQVGEFLERVDETPAVTGSGRELTESLAVLGLAVALYDQENGWPLLRQALTEVLQDDNVETVMWLSDIYTQREPDGSYGSNSNEVIYAVNCLDSGDPVDIDEAGELADEFAAVSPVFGPYVATGSVPCAHWPAPPTNEPHPITAAGAAPILVLGTTRDPATPYEASVALADMLESGTLLTRDGDGHTAYVQGNVCIDLAVDAYLLTGEPPADGTEC